MSLFSRVLSRDLSRDRRRSHSLKPSGCLLEDRTSLSIGGFNVGPLHVPALGTVLFGGQAPPPNVSTVGNPQPPTHPLSESIYITNRTPYNVSVSINWHAPNIAPYSVVVPANDLHRFYLNQSTDHVIYNPSVTFHPSSNANPITLNLQALAPGTHVSYASGQSYTINNYHFAFQHNVVVLSPGTI